MGWTEANPVSIGDPTKKAHYDALWDNADYLVDYIKGDNAQGSGATGHDHDGTDSLAIVDAAISQAKLKSTTGSVSRTGSTAWGHLAATGGTYCFWPQTKNNGDGQTFYVRIIEAASSGFTSYITWVALKVDNTAWTANAQFRYVQSSGEIHWLFIFRDKTTKQIYMMWQAPDHPCFGNSGDPVALPHPFGGFDPALHEIVVVNPTKSEVKDIRKAAKQEDKDFLEIITEQYELDETAETLWPTIDVTVDLDEDIDTGKKTVKKMKIPKPAGLKCYKLKEKL